VMAELALITYAAWFALAFGIRTVVHQRRTGDSGWRGVSGRVGSAEWFAGVSFSVALAIGVLGPVAEIAGLNRIVNHSASRWIGFVVALLGVGATFVAQVSMRDSWRIGVDRSETTELRTMGAFAVVRNPIFSAMGLTAWGLFMMVPNVVSLAGFAAQVIGIELQVRVVEEPYLRQVHGESYAHYEGRVGRFVPRFRRVGGAVARDTTTNVV
jgi:protein-S-isoprenylcysteine O-methyltransferase Ste14